MIHQRDETEDRSHAIFEHLAIGVVHSTAAGIFLNINSKFCELSGYAREEALALDVGRLMHPEDWANSMAARERMLAGEVSEYEREARIIRKDGSEIWVRITTSLIWRADETPGYFISLIQDISLQKRAEQESREAELRFRQVTENIREVFWLTDPLKNEILYVSPGYEAIWGRTLQSLFASPRQWIDAIHPDDRERISEAARTRQVTGDYDEEYRIVRPDGSVRWIRDRAFPVRGEDGEVIRVAGVAEDITDRKRATDEAGRKRAPFQRHTGQGAVGCH